MANSYPVKSCPLAVRHYDRDCGVARKGFYAGRLEGKTLEEKFNPTVLAAAEGRTVAAVYLGKRQAEPSPPVSLG